MMINMNKLDKHFFILLTFVIFSNSISIAKCITFSDKSTYKAASITILGKNPTCFITHPRLFVFDNISAVTIASPNNDTICYNTIPLAIGMTQPATGCEDTFSYQWQQQDGDMWTDIVEETDTTLQPPALIQTTSYRLKCSTSCGTVYSNTVTIYVYNDIQPATIATAEIGPICYNTTPMPIEMTQPATGGDGQFSYQWQQQEGEMWTDIDGGTDTTLQPPALTQTTSYRLKCSTSCGTAYSNSITIEVYGEIVAGELNGDTVCYNTQPNPIYFTVPPTGGGGSYAYQWEASEDGTHFSFIAGETQDTYQPPVLTQNTYYRVIVSSLLGCGADTTEAAIVTVYEPFRPGTIAEGDTICFNSAPNVLSMATACSGGTIPYSYQWFQSSNGTDFTPINGATDNTLQPPALTATTYYALQCSSAEGCGTYMTDTIEVFVFDDISAATIASPNNVPICYNTIPLAIGMAQPATGGDGTFSYQWQQQEGTVWTDIDGETDTILQPPALTQTTTYRLKCSTSCGTAYSNSATIIVYHPFECGMISGNETICYNTAPNVLTLTTSCTGGSTPYSYQWFQSSNGTDFTPISGATDSELQPPTLTATTYYTLQCSSAEGCGTERTNTVIVFVLDELAAATIASNDQNPICYNTEPMPIVMTYSAIGGNGEFTYQWQQLDGTVWTDIVGETDTILQPSALTQTTTYRLKCSTSCGTVYSNTVTINVFNDILPATIVSTEIAPICYDSIPMPIGMTQPATGGDGTFSYQWQQQDGMVWTDIDRETDTILQPPALTQTTTYRLKCSTSCGTVYSNNIIIEVYDKLFAGKINSDTVCYNTQPNLLSFIIPPTGGGDAYSYQWEMSEDGETFYILEDATRKTFQPPALTTTTFYRVIVTSLYGCSTDTTETMVLVYQRLNESTIGTTSEVCYGEDGDRLNTLTPTTGGFGNYTYQWQLSYNNIDWWSLIDDANSTQYTPTHLLTTSYYRLATIDLCGTVFSNSVKIIVNPLPPIQDIHGSDSTCGNQYETYQLDSLMQGFDYQWSIGDNSVGNIKTETENTDEIEVLWVSNNATTEVLATVTDQVTGCKSIDTLIISTCGDDAPDRTVIIRKDNSNILIAEENDESLLFEWGFTDRNNGSKHTIENDHHRYVLLPHTFDNYRYQYWLVLRYLPSSHCHSISFFDPSIGIEQVDGEESIIDIPSLSKEKIPITIRSIQSVKITCEIYDETGVLTNRYEGDCQNEYHWVAYTHKTGLYIVKIIANKQTFIRKVIVL